MFGIDQISWGQFTRFILGYPLFMVLVCYSAGLFKTKEQQSANAF